MDSFRLTDDFIYIRFKSILNLGEVRICDNVEMEIAWKRVLKDGGLE